MKDRFIKITANMVIAFSLRWARAWGLDKEISAELMGVRSKSPAEQVKAIEQALNEWDIPLTQEDIEQAFRVKEISCDNYKFVFENTRVFENGFVHEVKLSKETIHTEDLLLHDLMFDCFKSYVTALNKRGI